MKITFRSVSKLITGTIAGLGAATAIDEIISRNTKQTIKEPIDFDQISKAILIIIGSITISSLVGDVVQKYVANGVDKGLDTLNSLFKTKIF